MEPSRQHKCGNHTNRANQDFLLGGTVKRRISGRSTNASGLSHQRKLLKKLRSTLQYGDQKLYSSRQFAEGTNKHEEFFCYNEVDTEDNEASECSDIDEDERTGARSNSKSSSNGEAGVFQDVSINVVDLLCDRQLGNTRAGIDPYARLLGSTPSFQSQSDFPIKHLLTSGVLQEKAVKIENLNKVFCSQWLTDRQVIFGTKCNKIMVLDVQTKHTTQIPSLAPSPRSAPPDEQCGLHAMEINPSRTMIATGGRNPNDLAIYALPTLDPICVGELAHKDWIFGLSWIDDRFVVTGSRDTALALWRVPDPESNSVVHSSFVTSPNPSSSLGATTFVGNDYPVPSYSYIKAVDVKQCKSAMKIRDVVYNRKLQEIACVSLNGYIHLWNAETFSQKYSKKLPSGQENVCMSVHEDYGLYAIGSKSHTTLMDARTIQSVKKIASKYSGVGIRSTSFYSSLLSIGTGQGTVMFYDLRAGKYLESNNNSTRSATLKPSSGWTYPDEEIIMDMYRQKYTPAIYSHCVDMSGTRIFVAGGPLCISLCGNYIGLWH